MLPKAAVVILNWNGWQDTVELMASLDCTTYKPLLTIVIENDSSDDSVRRITDWLSDTGVSSSTVSWGESSCVKEKALGLVTKNPKKHYLFIKSDSNIGFCAGNNLGMEWAVEMGAEYILILNNDTLVASDFLQPMVEIAENDEEVGLVGGIITYCDDENMIWWAGGAFDRFLNNERLLDRTFLKDFKQQEPFQTEWISGCMTMIPAKIYHEFGGFPEHYFIWGEEWDHSLMVSHAGYKLMVAPKTRICHKVGRSLGIMKPLNYYYGIRNGLLFQRKFLSAFLWYPYFIYYLLNRSIRFSQFLLQGRSDLSAAGISAIWDFITGRTGQWRKQKT